ncbi:hypothetical protein ACIRH0_36130 [Streptomyces sp. NPDC093675]|uniref:hypothetical protein n=1 Tax=Streptomyces sp. NPDC093675 TaxID=3366049 RepID=UPI00381F9BE5
MTLPLVALLVVSGAALPPEAQRGAAGWVWSAVIGVPACCCVWLEWAGDRFGPWRAEDRPVPPRRDSRLRPRPGTRMALQMAAAVAAAFALGWLFFGHHWPWLVLTAYVAASGNRG